MTDEQLPCGRDPLDVWDHTAADRLDGHEQTCTYCQGVVSEYRVLAEPTRQWRSETVTAPAALLERVMATVRSNLRARNYLPLASPHGPVQLDTATAAGVLRWVVDQVDGARARSCRIELIDASVDDDHEQPDHGVAVDVQLTITARAGTHLPALAEQIRHMVRTVGEQLLGLTIDTVDIGIVDLFEPSGP